MIPIDALALFDWRVSWHFEKNYQIKKKMKYFNHCLHRITCVYWVTGTEWTTPPRFIPSLWHGKRGIGVRYGTSFVREAEVSCLNILSIARTKIKWFCPIFFGPKMGIWNILEGGGAAATTTTPLAPWPVRLWSAVYYRVNPTVFGQSGYRPP